MTKSLILICQFLLATVNSKYMYSLEIPFIVCMSSQESLAHLVQTDVTAIFDFDVGLDADADVIIGACFYCGHDLSYDHFAASLFSLIAQVI